MSIRLQIDDTMVTTWRPMFAKIFDTMVSNYPLYDRPLKSCHKELTRYMKQYDYKELHINGIWVTKDLLNFEFVLSGIDDDLIALSILQVSFLDDSYIAPTINKI